MINVLVQSQQCVRSEKMLEEPLIQVKLPSRIDQQYRDTSLPGRGIGNAGSKPLPQELLDASYAWRIISAQGAHGSSSIETA
jgi:hypothetical protein